MVESRYDCPVCPGLKMIKMQLPAKVPLVLDFCRRCGGVWFDYGEVEQLRRLHPEPVDFFNKKIIPARETFQMQCHSCSSFIDRNALTCNNCGWKNILDCPICQKPMKVTRHFSLQLDYCRACKGVWFDNKELSEIWNSQLDKIAHKHMSRTQNKNVSGIDTACFFVDVLAYSPEILVYGTEAAANIGESAISMVSKAPELSGSVIEGTGKIAGNMVEGLSDAAGAGVLEGIGDVAGNVFESIAEIISGIFS